MSNEQTYFIQITDSQSGEKMRIEAELPVDVPVGDLKLELFEMIESEGYRTGLNTNELGLYWILSGGQKAVPLEDQDTLEDYAIGPEDAIEFRPAHVVPGA